jgi:hypothetical protein
VCTGNCSGGVCCPAGYTNCFNGQCIDTQTDASNCGACGNPCFPDQLCLDGYCQGCSGVICGCRGATPVACGTTCCAGTACCGNSCQTAHSNGLGGTFYDCNPIYGSSNPSTVVAATAAANSWAPGAPVNTSFTGCGATCVSVPRASECAVCCYGSGSAPYAGQVAAVNTPVCDLACSIFLEGTASTWH